MKDQTQAATVPPGLMKDGHGGFLTTKITNVLDHFKGVLDPVVGKSRAWALWPMPFGLSCCAIEMMSMVGPRFDISRFGAEVLRFSPRQADLMIVAGTLTRKMGPACRRIYDEMPNPKWVMAMGACASTGGPFNTYSIVNGIDTLIPVDIYIPGCPPRPDAVLYGLQMLMKKVEGQGWRPFGPPVGAPSERGIDVHVEDVETPPGGGSGGARRITGT